MSKKLTREAKIYVTKRFGTDDPTSKDEVLEVRTFDSPHAEVSTNYGVTMSTGPYETARMSVGVVIPCYPEEIEEAMQFASDFCTSRVEKEKQEIREALGLGPDGEDDPSAALPDFDF